ncbi:hypothetical protein [Crocinitomix catalasitica]|uniref:hypothetical protein n=1 Tax=Crocinitomix catalasitica TaxID=184607 RepID=UPI0004828C28|nr:hypothetical protein [Crocinitomix catalasitica]|tara:strand:- start:69 stop:263 length:195 start_codon:yes stop_codon:yes gene_type:complete
MSQIVNCPTCGSKAKSKVDNDVTTYEAVQDEEAFKKVEQLKKALGKFKAKAEELEAELKAIRTI